MYPRGAALRSTSSARRGSPSGLRPCRAAGSRRRARTTRATRPPAGPPSCRRGSPRSSVAPSAPRAPWRPT
eukprot:6344080-Pyramimonas_sp.AAC.1